MRFPVAQGLEPVVFPAQVGEVCGVGSSPVRPGQGVVDFSGGVPCRGGAAAGETAGSIAGLEPAPQAGRNLSALSDAEDFPGEPVLYQSGEVRRVFGQAAGSFRADGSVTGEFGGHVILAQKGIGMNQHHDLGPGAGADA